MEVIDAINAELALFAATVRKAAPLPAFATLLTGLELEQEYEGESDWLAERLNEEYFERGCRSQMAALMQDMADEEDERWARWGLRRA